MRNKRKILIEEKKLWDEDFEGIQLAKSKKRFIIIRTIIFFCFFVVKKTIGAAPYKASVEATSEPNRTEPSISLSNPKVLKKR